MRRLARVRARPLERAKPMAGMRKMVRWNNDPRQQKLIQLLLAAGRSGDIVDSINVTNFLCQQGDWSLDEDRRRVAHALSAVQLITDQTSYERVKDIALGIGRAINDGQMRGVK
jgi:hypothetical protein